MKANDEKELNIPQQQAETDEPVDDIIAQNDFVDQQFREDDTEQKNLDTAIEASEPSFTLQPEKGLSPEPEAHNDEDEENYNLKQ